MDFNAILKAVQLVGAATPAFKAIFDQVVATFGEDDQTKLKQSYADAIAASDAAHRDAQAL